MSNIDNLSAFEKDILLRHFLHHMPQKSEDPCGKNNRGYIGSSYPLIYNKLCGRTIVEVGFPGTRAE